MMRNSPEKMNSESKPAAMVTTDEGNLGQPKSIAKRIFTRRRHSLSSPMPLNL
jgi:hypothetical protein